MSEYVYALQPPATARHAFIEGRSATVGHVRYAYKPYVGDPSQNARMEKELVRPLREAWRNAKTPRPDYVTLDEKDGVFTWPRGWIACRDDRNFGIRVRRIGRLEDGRIILDG